MNGDIERIVHDIVKEEIRKTLIEVGYYVVSEPCRKCKFYGEGGQNKKDNKWPCAVCTHRIFNYWTEEDTLEAQESEEG